MNLAHHRQTVELHDILPARRLVEIPPLPSLADEIVAIFRDSHRQGAQVERETAAAAVCRDTVTLP
jgi:hypothetical protein